MNIPVFHVDAFHDELFRGNPASVCLLNDWLPDRQMQAIAMENNLSETAFLIEKSSLYEIRWFTPKSEVDLCGHATLAAGHVIFNHRGYSGEEITFNSKSGKLKVIQKEGLLYLDFPSYNPVPFDIDNTIISAFGPEPLFAFIANYLMLVYPDEGSVRNLCPDISKIRGLHKIGIITTAQGDTYDFVSRFFAPMVGIDEDPVTGSAHSMLIPYWSGRLGRKKLIAYQCSRRGGELHCEDMGERVLIGGKAVTYMKGEIYL